MTAACNFPPNTFLWSISLYNPNLREKESTLAYNAVWFLGPLCLANDGSKEAEHGAP